MTNELINEVKKINRQAAIFLKRQIPLIMQRQNKCIYLDDKLANCFIWSDTPQGFNYWNNIIDKLPPEFSW